MGGGRRSGHRGGAGRPARDAERSAGKRGHRGGRSHRSGGGGGDAEDRAAAVVRRSGHREPREHRHRDDDAERRHRHESRRRDGDDRHHGHGHGHHSHRSAGAPMPGGGAGESRMTAAEEKLARRLEERKAGRLNFPESLEAALPEWFVEHCTATVRAGASSSDIATSAANLRGMAAADGVTLYEPLRVPDAKDRGRLMPFQQRVFVAAGVDSVKPSHFADPRSFTEVPTAAADGDDDSAAAAAASSPPPAAFVRFAAWQDTTVREILDNVRRYFHQFPERAPAWIRDATAASCSVAAVFPGADGMASMAPLGTINLAGPVGDLDDAPLTQLWRLARPPASSATAAVGADAPRSRKDPHLVSPADAAPRDGAIFGDVLLIRPVPKSSDALLATPPASPPPPPAAAAADDAAADAAGDDSVAVAA